MTSKNGGDAAPPGYHDEYVPLSQVTTASGASSYAVPPQRTYPGASLSRQATQQMAPVHHSDTDIGAPPPPAYTDSGNSARVDVDGDGLISRAQMLNDGRIDININQTTPKFANLLHRQLSHLVYPVAPPEPSLHFTVPAHLRSAKCPKLNIVIQIIGSRGDVQPFIALGRELVNNPPYHRVRVATHSTFKGFVEDNGLEFFNIGGDPAELMAYMVKNPGLMPGIESLKQGDIGKKRKDMYEMFQGCWRSCIEPGNGMPSVLGEEDMEQVNFVADAIIANPPSFAHIHCAERLAIPLHIMFTMPWSPTQSFPHPLANIQSSNTDANVTNFLTYTLVEMMTWQGLGDLVNRFREKVLGLDPVSTMWAPGMISRLKVPHTYCWSPALIPKPADWGPHIKISGFYFLELANNYTPAPDLKAFLDVGPPPVYIGFGSIVVDDPNGLTDMIFAAVKKAGVRALVSKGWGGLGGDQLEPPEGVFMLGNCPHDWLFKRVSCVVHHGGAGTTAIGIALGVPTVVVPFFGDQPFWGAMVARAGAGPDPVAFKKLTSDILASQIEAALAPSAVESGKKIAARISKEKGAVQGAEYFHQSLDGQKLRCLVASQRVAVWRVKRTEVRLSALAVAALAERGLLSYADLKLIRHVEWNTDEGPIEPISGAASALLGTMGSVMMGVGDFPREIFKAAKKAGHDNPRPKTIHVPKHTSHNHHGDSGNSTPQPGTPVSEDRPSLDGRQASVTSIKSVSTADTSIMSDKTDESMSPATPVISRESRSSHRKILSTLNRKSSRSGSRDSSPGLSRSDSQSRNKLHKHKPDPDYSSQAGEVSLDVLVGAGKGVGRITQALLRSPMEFTISLAQGFHNAPKLYGDDTVRKQERITGFQSGLKAAGKELAFGFYDGISGLVTQPIKGAKEEGTAGFFKGFGKGIGGIVLKPGAGIWGVYGYTSKGVYEEIRKLRGNDTNSYILAARTAQGFEDLEKATTAEIDDILLRWQALGVVRVKPKEKKKHTKEAAAKKKACPFGKKECGFAPPSRSNTSNDEEDEDDEPENRYIPTHPDVILNLPERHSTSTSERSSLRGVQDDENDSIEHAIIESVRTTSKGNPEEDRMIERAIRASISEVTRQGAVRGFDEDPKLLKEALHASVAATSSSRGTTEPSAEDEEALKEAIARSMQEYKIQPHATETHAAVAEDDAAHQAELRRALEESAKLPADEHLELALQRSKTEVEERQRKEDEEERIVLEYVKKASIAEQAHKATVAGGPSGDIAGPSMTERAGAGLLPAAEAKLTAEEKEQEELKRAIEESMKSHEG